MPYLYSEWTADDAKEKAARHPFGMGLGDEQASKVERLELWASSFSDPGNDWEEWRAFDADGEQIAVKRNDGY